MFLAPMEDVTDIGFRLLCKRFGASMVYTEFVSAEALVRDVKSTVKKLTISDTERPVGIQIYGRDVEAMIEAAKIVEQAGPDLIDLNFGCPVKKVAGKGAGAGMLQNIPKMLEITQKVVDAVKLPVTVKTRLGWSHEQLIITSLAEQLQDCGTGRSRPHRSELWLPCKEGGWQGCWCRHAAKHPQTIRDYTQGGRRRQTARYCEDALRMESGTTDYHRTGRAATGLWHTSIDHPRTHQSPDVYW